MTTGWTSWLIILLVNLNRIISLEREEEQLIRMLTRTYNFDFQVVVVDDSTTMYDFVKKETKACQIVTPNNFNTSIKQYPTIQNVGYFVFLKNNKDVYKLFEKADDGIFRNYTWFIRTNSLQENFGLELNFDSDVNFISKSSDDGEALNIHEKYRVQKNLILNKFGSYVNGELELKVPSKFGRRTNLHGLTLR